MNNILKKSILIIGLALYAMGVGAKSDWLLIGTVKTDRSKVFVDANSIRQAGNKTSAWEKFVETDNSYTL